MNFLVRKTTVEKMFFSISSSIFCAYFFTIDNLAEPLNNFEALHHFLDALY